MKPYYYALIRNLGDEETKLPTLAVAQAEAERMASDGRGLSIEILKCVGIASCSKASTFWMDGEGPEPVHTRYFIGSTQYTVWRLLPSGRLETSSPDCGGWGKSSYLDEEDLRGCLAGIREITAAELPEGIEP